MHRNWAGRLVGVCVSDLLKFLVQNKQTKPKQQNNDNKEPFVAVSTVSIDGIHPTEILYSLLRQKKCERQMCPHSNCANSFSSVQLPLHCYLCLFPVLPWLYWNHRE